MTYRSSRRSACRSISTIGSTTPALDFVKFSNGCVRMRALTVPDPTPSTTLKVGAGVGNCEPESMSKNYWNQIGGGGVKSRSRWNWGNYNYQNQGHYQNYKPRNRERISFLGGADQAVECQYNYLPPVLVGPGAAPIIQIGPSTTVEGLPPQAKGKRVAVLNEVST